MSPAASVEFRVPDSNHKEQPQPYPSSYSQYPSNPNLPSSFKFEYATASGVGNGSENCDVLFNSGRSVPGSAPIGRVQEVRSKPRLVKVRKGFGSRSLRSEAVSATSVDSGFNPFRSRSQSSISSSKISAASGEPQNFTFVFGESSSLGDPNSNSNGTYTDQKRGGSFVGIGNASAPEKEKLKTSSERENGKFDNFGLGNGRFNGSMKSEGSADTYKGGEFQNRAHSSFVFGATSTNVELNSTSCGGTQPPGESTASSGIFSGESEGGFSAFFVDTSGNHGMKENDKPGCGSNRRTGSVPGDDGNLSVGNDPLGKGVSSDRVGQACFVFKSSGGSYFTGRAGGTKMSDQIKVESSTHQGSVSGDRCSTMNFFGIPSDVKLSEDLKKLNIDNLPKAFNVENAHFCSTKAPVGANGTFTSSTRTMSTSNKMDGMKAAGSSKGIDEMNNGASVRPVDEHLFVFSASASYSSSSGVSSHCSAKHPENGEEKVKGEDPSSFPAFGLDTATKCGAYDTSREDKKVEAMDFKVPQWDTFSFSANMHNTLDGKSEHGVKSRMFKDTKPKKTKGKTRKHDILKQKLQQEIGSDKSTPSVNVDSTDCYSPMDFSPYQESTDNEQCSPEGSVKLNPLPFTDVSYTPSGISHVSIDKEDVNIAATSVNSQPKLFSEVDAASGDAGTGVHSNASHQAGDGSQLHFASSSETGAQQFMFGPASTQGHPLPMKRPHKKKYRVKPGHVPSAASAVHGTSIGTTSTDKKQVENDELSSKSNVKLKSMTDEERTTSTLSSVEAACEKWRLRGNQAYKNGELLRAEDFYTWGINCIPSDEASGFSVKPLVLCYSNRAATRMALGRIREALEDCLVAVTLDPCFLKAQIRAANCHLMLGELEEAMQNFNKCMESGGSICLDRKLVIVASDGLQRAKKVAEYISRAEGFLKLKTSEDADIALGTIAEGISISLYSEKLLELKAEALCLLQKYEDAIQLCEKTLEFADKNFSSISSNNCNVNGSDIKANSNMKLWRSRILAKCYFHLGRLETALGVLDKHEGGRSSQDADPLVVTITELLKHKNAGNEAFRSGKHAEAVEHYTSAVSCSIESRPFAAVCFCNRAATYQILGQIADAISDCSVAMALDENYVKAVSRRANLLEKIRDYKQAASDLEKLVSILSPGKIKQSGSSNQKELDQVYQRLSSMEEHAKKEVPLDLYLILGVKRADTASEIKKAYRKAALKHHPDKAGQLLVRSESGVDGRLWKEIAESVHKDSDRLFKMIGEAYAVLSDPEKREEYDLKEDMRSESRVNGVNRGASRREPDFYGYTYAYPYPFERSTNRRHWQGDYKSKYSSTSRW